MPIREVQVSFTPGDTSCRRCGHASLHNVAQPAGDVRLWLAICPACGTVQDRAAIPESFLQGLPPAAVNHYLH